MFVIWYFIKLIYRTSYIHNALTITRFHWINRNIADIPSWVRQNMLELTDAKGDFIYLAVSHYAKSIETQGLHIG